MEGEPMMDLHETTKIENAQNTIPSEQIASKWPTTEDGLYSIVTEGKASVLCKGNDAFYNPVQEVNRDLSTVMIKLHIEQLKKEKIEEAQKKGKPLKEFEGVTVLEALSATGLRSIRYAKEIEGIKSVVANDLEAAAVEAIKRNIEYNKVEGRVIPSHEDATLYMYQNREVNKQFDIVDIDPYGGAAIFLDGAVQCVSEGGLLCVTCTDMAVLCGNHMEACYAKYGIVPLHARYCQEMALRILLGSISMHANKYKRYIVPVLSLSIDFYIRVFVRVYSSAAEVKNTVTKMGHVYQCVQCDSFWTQTLAKKITTEKGTRWTPSTLGLANSFCTECGTGKLKIGGPVWLDPIHNQNATARALEHLKDNAALYNQAKKVYGLLYVANEELPYAPLYYQHSALGHTLHVPVPTLNAIRSAIKTAGYSVSSSHANPEAIKTNAPNNVIWDIMRGWVKLNPVKNISPTSPAALLLAVKPTVIADFTIREDAKLPSRETPRYIPNPSKDWGPRAKAGKEVDTELRKKNQGKRTKNREKRPYVKIAKKEESTPTPTEENVAKPMDEELKPAV